MVESMGVGVTGTLENQGMEMHTPLPPLPVLEGHVSPTLTRLWTIYYEQAQRVPETNATQPCPCLRQGKRCIARRKRVLGQGPGPVTTVATTWFAQGPARS